jgi:Ca2+/H+ antiporter, TMEM165/GDT1 family
MTDLFTAFGLALVAELGDKSQLLALALAVRHRWWQVLIGVATAAVVVLGLAALIGGALGAALLDRALAIAGAVVFLGAAVYTGFVHRDDEAADAEVAARPSRSVVPMVAGMFILAELGDKTMIATTTLATQYTPWLIWIGAAVGMTVASGTAIFVGRLLGAAMPARTLRILSALAFAGFGIWLLIDGLT